MIDSKVSVRRFLRAMLAASPRAECLGLVVVADPQGPAGEATARATADLRDLVGPYLGVVRPVAAGAERAGVVLPEGLRVLADGLDAHCWPGSETAFREELAAGTPASWDHSPHGRGGPSTDAARSAATELAWFLGLEGRASRTVAVLDPAERHGALVGLPRGTAAADFCERLVDELDGWPRRRVDCVTELLGARLELAAARRPGDRRIETLQEEYRDAAAQTDPHRRAVLLARCADALWDTGLVDDLPRVPLEAAPPGRPVATGDAERTGPLRHAIVTLSEKIETGDKLCDPAAAAQRALGAVAGVGIRRVETAPPSALAGWRFDRVRPTGPLHRLTGHRR